MKMDFCLNESFLPLSFEGFAYHLFIVAMHRPPPTEEDEAGADVILLYDVCLSLSP
jgi:hypothetical protein